MLVTIFLRAAIFPLVVRVQKNNVRMQAIQPQSKALMDGLKEANTAGDKAKAQAYGHELTKLWRDNDCNPWKSMVLPLVQMPLFMSFFFAIRKMAYLPVPQLKEGGIGWVMDLTLPDPYYILPITSMALTLAVLEVGFPDGWRLVGFLTIVSWNRSELTEPEARQELGR
jgi:YidC/Oxa1 family membrane protein insertase